MGKSEDSDADLVGTASGVKVARTIRRRVQPYRAEDIVPIKGVPSNFTQEALGVKVKYRPMPALPEDAPFVDEEAEAVKKAFLEQRSDSEDEGGDAIRQGILLDDKIVPKTSENAPTPPASPKAQPRAAIAEPRQAKKALVEERALKRPANSLLRRGKAWMLRRVERGEVRQKSRFYLKEARPGADLSQTQVHQQGHCIHVSTKFCWECC